MGYQELENLGENIKEVIESAVSSQSYQRMNQSITKMVNDTLKQYQSSMPKRQEQIARQQAAQRQPKIPDVYGQVSGFRTKNILKVVFGGMLTLGMLSGVLATAIIHAATGAAFTPEIITLIGTLVGAGVLGSGISGLGKVSRFKKYRKAIGARSYCEFGILSRAVGKPLKYVIKDVKKMIGLGWFLEGHVDQKETCLITTDETYRQYQAAEEQYQLEKQAKDAELIRSMQQKESRSPEVDEVLKQGNAFLDKIHRSNDAIPGEEISAKISLMEQIVQQIFTRAEEHPEIIPDLKRMMDYYLPTTVKLLDAYEDMDKQPIQGENIRASKKEIEDTIDTLNQAFIKLLDSVFQDTAWDVSSDITALNTILAQEGLTESGLQAQVQTQKR